MPSASICPIFDSASSRPNGDLVKQVYSDWFTRSARELVLSMEAERFTNLAFDPAKAESERKVILEGRLTAVENDSFGYLEQEMYTAHYQKHPAAGPCRAGSA
jgi:predicted Zn-dependent peptidase